MNCPSCGAGMEDGAIYVRGFGGALFWSLRKDAGFTSRKGLDQLDLDRISIVPTRAQAIIEGWRCPSCHLIAFNSGEAIR